MTIPISEDERVELWKLEQFVRMGFDGDAVSALLFWDAEVHEARKLVDRGCPHDLALRILMPLDMPPVTTQDHVAAYANIKV